MAGSHSFNKPCFQDPELPTSPILTRSKSSLTNLIFSKSIIVLLVLVVLPIFPSQAPEFINQTPLTKIWELIYLLFIGIVVSYGLFSKKRTAKISSEAYPNFVTTKTQIWSPLTGVLQISSMFENGFESSCGLDGLRIPPIRSPLSKGVYTNVDDCSSDQFLVSKSCLGNFNESSGKKVRQSCNGNYVFDESEKYKSEIEYKPLGLPIRSLRSKNVDSSGTELKSDVSGSSFSFKDSCHGGDNVDRGRVKGLVPTNLEGKFTEAVAVPSPIPWVSRSARMEMREKMGTAKSSSNFKSNAAGEFTFPSLKSQFFRCSMPSQPDSKDSSSKSSSFASIPSKLPNPKMEDLKGKEKPDGSRPSFLQSFRNSTTRHFSIGSSSDMNVQISSNGDCKDFIKSKMGSLDSSQKTDFLVHAQTGGRFPNTKMDDLKGKEKLNVSRLQSKQPLTSNTLSLSMGSSTEVKVNGIENYLKDFLETKEENAMRTGRSAMDHLKLTQRPAALVSSYTPGKSVRKIRSSEKFLDAKETGKVFPSGNDEKFGMKFAEEVGLENIPMDTGTRILDNIAESKSENFDVSSDEEGAGLDMLSDAEPHSGEVDRRADEFIAKFKEQIRLQKAASHLNLW